MNTEYQTQKNTKTVIVEEQSTEKMRIGTVEVQANQVDINLTYLLRTLIGDLHGKLIRAYDFEREVYVGISSEDCTMPLSFINGKSPSLILLKIRNQNTTSLCSTNSIASQEFQEVRSNTSSFKRQRSKERIIYEVIQIVKKWREIHLSKNNMRKISLQDAAKMVGLPKKSLDDYYYQLRLGEKYEFDFRVHLFERIGVLRTFLKNLKENSQLDRTEKHPKKLKIIDEFQQLSELYSAQRGRMDYGQYQDMQQQDMLMKIEQQCQPNNQQMQRDDISLQNQFYNQFEYMLNDKDPFLSCDFNFKKKSLEENSDELFF